MQFASKRSLDACIVMAFYRLGFIRAASRRAKKWFVPVFVEIGQACSANVMVCCICTFAKAYNMADLPVWHGLNVVAMLQAALHSGAAFQLAALLKSLAEASLQDLPHSKPGDLDECPYLVGLACSNHLSPGTAGPFALGLPFIVVVQPSIYFQFLHSGKHLSVGPNNKQCHLSKEDMIPDAGAGIFLCKASRILKEVLFAAPRHAIHQALTQPHSYLGNPATSGISADLEDVCIAFQTFREVRRCTFWGPQMTQ